MDFCIVPDAGPYVCAPGCCRVVTADVDVLAAITLAEELEDLLGRDMKPPGCEILYREHRPRPVYDERDTVLGFSREGERSPRTGIHKCV